jgi:transcriptional regulator with XRE-family HTH domain
MYQASSAVACNQNSAVMSENSPDPQHTTFGVRIAQERKRLGLTQAELAGHLGLGRSMIGMIETGRTRLDVAVLLALESAVCMDVAFVLTGRRAAVAAADMLDWRLAEEILKALACACRTYSIQLSPAGTARALRLLYRLASLDGRVSQGQVDDFVQLGTGFAM